MPLDTTTISLIRLALDPDFRIIHAIYLWDVNGNYISEYDFQPNNNYDYGIDASDPDIIAIQTAYTNGAPITYRVERSTFAETVEAFEASTDPSILRPANWMVQANYFYQQSLGLSTTSPGGQYSFSGTRWLQALLYKNAETEPDPPSNLAFSGTNWSNLDGWTESAEIPSGNDERWVTHVVTRGNDAGNGAIQWSVQIGYDVIQDTNSPLSVRYTRDFITFTADNDGTAFYVQMWNLTTQQWGNTTPLALAIQSLERQHVLVASFFIDVSPGSVGILENKQVINAGWDFTLDGYSNYFIEMSARPNSGWGQITRKYGTFVPPEFIQTSSSSGSFVSERTMILTYSEGYGIAASLGFTSIDSQADYYCHLNFVPSTGEIHVIGRNPDWFPIKIEIFGVKIGV